MAVPSSASVHPQQTGSSQASPPSNSGYRGSKDAGGESLAKTVLSIGGKTYPVDPQADPQTGGGGSKGLLGAVGDDHDPIAIALADLRKGGPARNGGGSISRGGGSSRTAPIPTAPTPVRKDTATSKVNSPPSAAQSQPSGTNPRSKQSIDYRDVANSIVGAHPISRPSSPNANPNVHAAHMQPPPQSNRPIHEEYQQAFPGERRNSFNRGQPPPAMSGNSAVRSPSPAREGFVGIGAQGRSVSPQPFQGPGSRAPSPNPQQSATRPLSSAGYAPHPQGNRTTSPGYNGMRSASPSNFGISLNAAGQVEHDSKAEEYARMQNPYSQPQQPFQPAPQQHSQQTGYGYGQQQPGYNQPPAQQQQPLYNPHQAPQQTPQAQPQQSQYPPAASPGYQGGYAPGPTAAPVISPSITGNSFSYNNFGGAPQQPQPAPGRQQSLGQPGGYGGANGYGAPPPQHRAPSPAPVANMRAPSPAPAPSTGTPGGIEDSDNVLFYGKLSYWIGFLVIKHNSFVP